MKDREGKKGNLGTMDEAFGLERPLSSVWTKTGGRIVGTRPRRGEKERMRRPFCQALRPSLKPGRIYVVSQVLAFLQSSRADRSSRVSFLASKPSKQCTIIANCLLIVSTCNLITADKERRETESKYIERESLT